MSKKIKKGEAVLVTSELVSVYGFPAEWQEKRENVTVIHVSGKYAMVQRYNFVRPFVCEVDELEQER